MKRINIILKKLELLRNGTSVHAFARHCNVADSTIRAYFNNKREPQSHILQKIAAACNVPWNWLDYDAWAPMIPEWRMAEISDKNLEKILKIDKEVAAIEKADSGHVFPVVNAFDDEKTHLSFFCIHCNKWHHHGRGGEKYPFQLGRGGMAGHRIAHCMTDNSPFNRRGYILDVVGKLNELKEKRNEGKSLFCPECRKYYSAAYNACECGFINKKRQSKQPELARFYAKLLDPLSWATLPGNKGKPAKKSQSKKQQKNADSAKRYSGDDIARSTKEETREESLQMVRHYRELADLDADTLGEIQTWLNDLEKVRPGFTSWFRLEFQNRFPEFDEWKSGVIKKREGNNPESGTGTEG